MIKKDFSKIPANQLFDFSLIQHAEKYAEVILPLKQSYLQEGSVVHGGIISTLADTAAVYAIDPATLGDLNMTSIEFKMNFLSPAILANGNLKAKASVVKRGRKIAVCEVDVFQKDKLIAKGLFTYMLFQRQ